MNEQRKNVTVGDLDNDEYTLVQQDTEVMDILEMAGLEPDEYPYLIVKVGDGDYDEVWGINGFELERMAHRIL